MISAAFGSNVGVDNEALQLPGGGFPAFRVHIIGKAAAFKLVVRLQAEHLEGGPVGKYDLSLALYHDGEGRILD